MTAWRTFLHTVAKNPISAFAVLSVAATAAFLAYMTSRASTVLESPSWCATAIQAEKISPGTSFAGLKTCTDLLRIQLEAMALGFHISIGGFVFVLIVLVVIVIAGARASGKLTKDGITFDMARQDAAEAAQTTAAAAQDTADAITEGAA